jgi:hypothetical protein
MGPRLHVNRSGCKTYKLVEVLVGITKADARHSMKRSHIDIDRKRGLDDFARLRGRSRAERMQAPMTAHLILIPLLPLKGEGWDEEI